MVATVFVRLEHVERGGARAEENDGWFDFRLFVDETGVGIFFFLFELDFGEFFGGFNGEFEVGASNDEFFGIFAVGELTGGFADENCFDELWMVENQAFDVVKVEALVFAAGDKNERCVGKGV